MSLSLASSPKRLAALTGFGCALAFGGFFAVSRSHDSTERMFAASAVTLVGIVLIYWTPFQLREGVLNDRWPAEQIAPLRRVIEHAAWKTVIAALFVAMLAAFLAGRQHRYQYWLVFLLLQAMTQVSNAFRIPTQSAGPAAPLDWSKIPPLQSDHWGER